MLTILKKNDLEKLSDVQTLIETTKTEAQTIKDLAKQEALDEALITSNKLLAETGCIINGYINDISSALSTTINKITHKLLIENQDICIKNMVINEINKICNSQEIRIYANNATFINLKVLLKEYLNLRYIEQKDFPDNFITIKTELDYRIIDISKSVEEIIQVIDKYFCYRSND